MKTTIYYFSATGNSLFVAKKFVEKLGDCQLISIASEIKKEKIDSTSETIGFVFPLYFSGLPFLVNEFIKKINLTNAGYIFAIATAGEPIIGAALYQINKILKEKEKKLNFGAYVAMVDNYLPIYEIPPENKQLEINKKASLKIEDISKAILNQKNKRPFEFTIFLGLVHNPWKRKKDKFDTVFFVDSNCNGCSICEKVCPVTNIKMVNNKPLWQHNCEFCLACIHHCPQKSIQVDKKSDKKSRFTNPEIKLKEIIQGKA